MSEMERQKQILREIDKLDKIGLDGVCAMLGDGMKDGSGAFNSGVGLLQIEVGMLRLFFSETAGRKTSEATIESVKRAFTRLGKVRNRIALMVELEETVVKPETGYTAWGRLLDMPQNEDETWNGGGRPKNIGWALDDIVKAIRARVGER